jgi:predicted RNA methylase
MKLSKAEQKLQREVKALLDSDKTLTFEELEYIYENFNPGSISDVTVHSAYFTPLDMAYDFALFAGRHGVCVDMCAGIGILTFCAQVRDTYHGNITKQICIERNPEYLRIGRRLLPNVEWILGDMFDQSIWNDIIKRHGPIDCIVSNPPFGKVSKTDCDRSWLKYQGADLDIASIEIALKHATYVDMILPTGSVPFKMKPYYQKVENRKIEKLKSDTGLNILMQNPGIDTSVYGQFKNTKIQVECVEISVEDEEMCL